MLETERLYIREYRKEDLSRFYEIYSESAVASYIEALKEDRDEEAEIMEAYQNIYRLYGYGMWTVCLRENDMVIGRAGFDNYELDGKNMPELGYVIDAGFRKRGYAYEACSAICEYAKKYMYVDEIICTIHKKNEASIRLALKLGFEKADCPICRDEHNQVAGIVEKMKEMYILRFDI